MSIQSSTNNKELHDKLKDINTIRDNEMSDVKSTDPFFFKEVKISIVALQKMTTHTVSGSDNEVMGMLCGRVEGNIFWITDVLELPVEGTETRVNAGAQANEYLFKLLATHKNTFKRDNCIGWYHSHPGQGCWLSGIDVNSQRMYQNAQDPYLAIVVDPKKTLSQGRVELGCFRTIPEGVASTHKNNLLVNIPDEKAADFGAYANQFYSLSYSIYLTDLDLKICNEILDKNFIRTLIANNKDNIEYLKSGFSNLSKKMGSNSVGDFERLRDAKNLVGDLKQMQKLNVVTEEMKTKIN